MAEFSPEIHCRILFLTDFFAFLHCSAPSTWSKSVLHFFWGRTSNRIGPDPEAGGSRFWTSKTSLSPQVAQKTGPATKSQILLTTRLMSTSGALTHLHSLEIAPSAQIFYGLLPRIHRGLGVWCNATRTLFLWPVLTRTVQKRTNLARTTEFLLFTELKNSISNVF